MSTPDDPQGELDRLLAATVDGELSPADRERLAELLRDRPDLRGQYLDYLMLDSLLQWEQPVPVTLTAAPAPRRFWRGWYLAVAALAAGVLAAVVLWPRPPAGPGDVAQAERTDDTVAVLQNTAGAVWGESALPTRPGSPLPPGRLRLAAGVVRLEFYCGATVILEGPADFHLISRTRAFCAAGKLRATVPPHAEGFTIETPTLDVVDRGTEFGLTVGGGNRTEVHVFQGQVDLYGAGAAGKGRPNHALTTGQGVRVDGAGAANAIPSDPAAFVSSRKLDDQLADVARRRHQEWEAAAAEWHRDPALRVHFTFQGSPPWGRTLADHAGRDPACNGAIVGCAWVGGRWPGRQGLEFKRVSDRVRLTVPGEFDSVTLATWVRVDGLPNVNNSLLMADGWEPGEFHWQIGQDGTVILGVQSDPKSRGAHYHAVGAVTPDRFGQWMHLAAVYDRDGGVVRHYLDGRPVSEEAILFDIPLRVGDAEVGNWNVAAHRNKTLVRYLNGCMDELMLFTRALSGDEVARLYAQGRPPS